MLNTIIPVTLITISAFFLVVASKLKFSYALPITLFSVIITLYIFYVFDQLHIGRILMVSMLVLQAIGLIVIVLKKLREKSTEYSREFIKEQLFNRRSFIFLVYIAYTILFFCLSSNKFIYDWDCLRLWGACPKALWTYETLQLGKDAIIYPYMQSYLPGMPLLCYFMTGFSDRFDDSVLFFTYAFFEFILILPIIEHISDKCVKNCKSALFCFVYVIPFVVLFPWIVSDLEAAKAYANLFIDPSLGLLSGFYFSMCFNKQPASKSIRILTALSGVCLVLFKDSGLLFAVFGIVGVLSYAFISHSNKKAAAIWSICLGAVFLSVWGVWRFLLNKYSIHNNNSMTLFIPNKRQLFDFIKRLLRDTVTKTDFIFLTIGISFFAALMIVFFIKMSLSLYNSHSDSKKEFISCMTLLSSSLLFAIGYYYLFNRPMSEPSFPSYSRYLNTLTLCGFYVLIFDIVTKHFTVVIKFVRKCKITISASIAKYGKLHRRILSLCLTMMVLFIYVTCLKMMYGFNSKSQYYDEDFRNADIIEDVLKNTVSDNEEIINVYLCMPGVSTELDNLSITQHAAYYNLIDDHMSIKNGPFETDISSIGLGYSSDEFLRRLIDEDYSYVFVLEIDDTFYQEFSDILGDVNVGDKCLVYRVDKDIHSLVRV